MTIRFREESLSQAPLSGLISGSIGQRVNGSCSTFIIRIQRNLLVIVIVEPSEPPFLIVIVIECRYGIRIFFQDRSIFYDRFARLLYLWIYTVNHRRKPAAAYFVWVSSLLPVAVTSLYRTRPFAFSPPVCSRIFDSFLVG